ncbi:DUF1826 domain-containing protein [Sedimentitalea sp. XS_ASV28]|uniref:DUF1826 domain-containing protein n=1 Tax=Sedimentitalea sp. XS_ASV28 TaxID=3241296 RepID=UPI003514CCA5
MTLHRPIDAGMPPGVLMVSDREDFGAIRSPGIEAMIWQRRPHAALQTWLDGLEPGLLPRMRVTLRPGQIRATLTETFLCAGLPAVPERSLLIDDITFLADVFSQTMCARWLRLRLDVVDTNACRRFHVDRVTARLVCTYRGTGTQYGVSPAGEPDVIHTVPTGAPFVMRGTLWPAGANHDLRHRSPPVAGTGETRLVLVLDPVTDPEEG